MRERLIITTLGLGGNVLSFLAYAVLLRFFGGTIALDDYFRVASVPMAAAGIATAMLFYWAPARFASMAATDVLALEARTYRRMSGMYLAALVLLSAITLLASALGLLSASVAVLLPAFAFLAICTFNQALFSAAMNSAGRHVAAAKCGAAGFIGLLAGVLVAVGTECLWAAPAAQGLMLWLVTSYHRYAPPAEAAPRPTEPLGLPNFIRNSPWLLMSALAFTTFPVIDAALAYLLPTGSLAAIAFTQKLAVAAGAFVALGVHATSAATIARLVADGRLSDAVREITTEARGMSLRGICLAVGAFSVSPWLAPVLFANGTAPETVLRALPWLVLLFLLGVPAMTTVPLVFRLLHGLGHYRVTAFLGIMVVLMYGAIAAFALPYLGITAFALGYVSAWWLTAALGLVLAFRMTASRPNRAAR